MDERTPMGTLKRRRNRKRYSHGGCANCKKRSIKCDETLPGCLACQRKQLKCTYEQKIFVYQPDNVSKKKNKFEKVQIDQQASNSTASTYVPESAGSFEVIDMFIDGFKENFDQGRQSTVSNHVGEDVLECKRLDKISSKSALQVPAFVHYWKPYSEERYKELFEKLDPTVLRRKMSIITNTILKCKSSFS